MSDTNIVIKDNTATIQPSASITGTLEITTNSPAVQIVTVEVDGQASTYSGQGERQRIGSTDITAQEIKVTFEYIGGGNSSRLPSSIKSGGPYTIGNMIFLIVVVENGDDSDYNDVVLQLKWKS